MTALEPVALAPVVEDKCLRPRCRCPGGKAAHQIIAGQPVATRRSGEPLYQPVGQSFRHLKDFRVGTVSAIETDFMVVQCHTLSEGVKRKRHISSDFPPPSKESRVGTKA